MTVPQFSRPGAVDLSALRNKSAAAGSGGDDAATGAFVIDVVGEQELRAAVIERSMSVVVLVSFWSEQVAASVEINTTLGKLADEFGGRFLFAKVDTGTQPELAQALGIPGLPLVCAALGGQLAPLIQESLPEAEMRTLVQQILQAAASSGVSGVAEPVDPADQADTESAGQPEPKYPAAEQALMSGDLDAAIAAYRDALTSSPGDADASLGLAQAQLLKRTQGVDLPGARSAAADRPLDVAAQTLVADLDLVGGHVDDAFTRLIELVRRSAGDERDAARQHLIELFDVVGNDDERVARARRALTSALF
ncbi:MAG: co-chaperone YbbN [Nocardioidaceae bacterium]